MWPPKRLKIDVFNNPTIVLRLLSKVLLRISALSETRVIGLHLCVKILLDLSGRRPGLRPSLRQVVSRSETYRRQLSDFFWSPTCRRCAQKLAGDLVGSRFEQDKSNGIWRSLQKRTLAEFDLHTWLFISNFEDCCWEHRLPPLFYPNFEGVPLGLDCQCCRSKERRP